MSYLFQSVTSPASVSDLRLACEYFSDFAALVQRSLDSDSELEVSDVLDADATWKWAQRVCHLAAVEPWDDDDLIPCAALVSEHALGVRLEHHWIAKWEHETRRNFR